MELFKKISTTLFAVLLIMSLSACDKGPAEKAGEAIDDAASDVADKSEETAEAIKDKLDN